VAHFGSSVSVEESFDKVVAYTTDPDHVRRFVSTVQGRDTIGEVTQTQGRRDQRRHRIEWEADGQSGWLQTLPQGHVAVVAAEVHTAEEAGAQERLEQALGELKAAIESADAGDVALAETSPSFVVETVLKAFVRAIPEGQRTALTPYLRRAPGLDGSAELEDRRAHVCAVWASDAQAGPGDERPTELAQAVELAEVDADTGWLEGERRFIEAAARAEHFDPQDIGEGELPPGFQRRLNDVYKALDKARTLAERHGWDAVPWPGLLEELFAITA
jgi:hypothetical protein